MAPCTFAVESYVTGVKTRFVSVPVAPGLNVNTFVFSTMDVLITLPVVFPTPTLTKAVAAVYSNICEYQTTPTTSATTTQPPHVDAAVFWGPPNDADAAEMRGWAVPGLSVSGQWRFDGLHVHELTLWCRNDGFQEQTRRYENQQQ